jgi:NADPH:quinone reductase-like Zn-dependent oxidoreductase
MRALPVAAYEPQVFAVPACMPFEHVAAFTIAYRTSNFAVVYRAPVKRGETVLVYGAVPEAMAALFSLYERGLLPVQIDASSPLDRAVEALHELSLRRVQGNVVLTA